MSSPHGARDALLSGLLALALGACTAPAPAPASEPAPLDPTDHVPRLGGDEEVVAESDPEKLRHLRLVATNLVAALVQIPELGPATATLQVNPPTTAFGNIVVRALEEAGYGLQRVDSDQGRNYVRYSQRFAQTESGPVEDFTLSVGRITLSREYVTRGGNIYPSSLLEVSGTDFVTDIDLADDVFREQGGEANDFISGTRPSTGIVDDAEVRTVDVNDFDELPLERRTPARAVLARAREQRFEREAERAPPDLERFERYRRTVLIFDDTTTQFMGAGNKRAVRLVVRELEPEDLLVIRACHDADGSNERARAHAIRIEEELAGHGVPGGARWIAPCVRASYRHPSDDAPAPVELIHYRPIDSTDRAGS